MPSRLVDLLGICFLRLDLWYPQQPMLENFSLTSTVGCISHENASCPMILDNTSSALAWDQTPLSTCPPVIICKSFIIMVLLAVQHPQQHSIDYIHCCVE